MKLGVIYALALGAHPTVAFEFPKLPTFFKPQSTTAPVGSFIDDKKQELLEAVSYTGNGKTASTETQARVVSIVREIEKVAPVPDTLLTDPVEAKRLDGTWFLQYTSPSEVGDVGNADDDWKAVAASEDGAVEIRQFTAKGTVSAAGVTVDTSNRSTKQIFDVEKNIVSNEVNLDFGKVTVKGPFRRSENVSNRAIVAFKDLELELNGGIKLSLGWVFSLIKSLKGTDVGGWLETTYLGEDMRIGRGNKGTMFVLTRDPDAVKP
mmetsp:Transcript_58688/g.174655  ORF Transcript_58688/g.174655 Transcript_58688/m.174655 type:complete len:264 (-) Transcript_58688:358-1149(-)|eukprot:CAMPEP_0113533566 /NCGR_PEP_ID=MMETSP0015_2-20120614/4681_1 /TAXON_ID=2838 /ORGANISM="Odontella" /LENGTH=263 /DNA_ID=CAMNT_0000432643 /DNA_START=74 /DNA_END=865 /DNA_ORIENTATION=+ /assembly_acc=CAM_ASM_000160